jgi:hypothetical protein
MSEGSKIHIYTARPENEKNLWHGNFTQHFTALLPRFSLTQLQVLLSEKQELPKIEAGDKLVVLADAQNMFNLQEVQLPATLKPDDIFLCCLDPLDPLFLPQWLQGLKAYPFFVADPSTGKIYTSAPELAPLLRNQYWSTIFDLASDMSKTFKHLQNKISDQQVYLAETHFNLVPLRDLLIRDIQQSGYQAWPITVLNWNDPNAEERVMQTISKARFSVHLVHPFSEEGSSERWVDSIEARQLVLLGQVAAKNRSLRVFIWLSGANRQSTSARQDVYEFLSHHLADVKHIEIIETPPDTFRTTLRKRMLNLLKQYRPTPLQDAVRSVYVISPDGSVPSYIEQSFRKNKIEALTLHSNGNNENLLEIHRRNLDQSDAVVICYNGYSESWFRSKVSDVMKAPGYGRQKPFSIKAVCAPGANLPLQPAEFLIVDKQEQVDEKINFFIEKLLRNE